MALTPSLFLPYVLLQTTEHLKPLAGKRLPPLAVYQTFMVPVERTGNRSLGLFRLQNLTRPRLAVRTGDGDQQTSQRNKYESQCNQSKPNLLRFKTFRTSIFKCVLNISSPCQSSTLQCL